MENKTLLCLGDSITDCGRLLDDPPLGHGYVSILHQQLNNFSTKINWNTINKGFDGFTISRVFDQIRAESYLQSADVITLLIGINDIGLMMNTNRSPLQIDHMFQNFYLNYKGLLSVLSHTKAHLLLLEPFIFPYPAKYRIWIPYIDRMSYALKKLSCEFNTTYIELQKYFLENCASLNYSDITTDGIHLTHLGHTLLANRLFSEINAIIK